MNYEINLIRIIDGDTIVADINLGFDIILKSQTIRLNTIDTPEIHSEDEIEKKQGLISKQKLAELLTNQSDPPAFNPKNNIILFVNKNNYRDKYGRILGIIFVATVNINSYLVANNYAVTYEGENKDKIKDLHLKNRQALIDRKELILQ
jgi:endonuclease YncB( thermonuclease family)